MQIITTHLNADFDCLASMVAAKKLYPEAHMVFSGSAEKSVNRYLNEINTAIDISRIKDIDLDRVTRLILVDTQDPARIGNFQSLIRKPGVEIHVYDHHPEIANKIPAGRTTIRKRGAAATILFEVLSEKKIPLTREESTLMALGIYQDTHSLISPSTTPQDINAVSSLVQMGADLNVVAEFVQPRLNTEQVDVFNDLIRNLEISSFNGVEVALASATVDYFVEDLAYVVHRVMELENFQALFALVRMDRRVYLIARSRTKTVDVAEIARQFEGGGHIYAASASIRDMTMVQVREKLLHLLNADVQPLYLVRDIMHFPVVSVGRKDTIESVEKILTRFNLNTIPVMEGKIPVGLITRQIVEKAIHHKMALEKTEDLMIREFSVTSADSYFKTIIPVIIEEKQKLIPVVHPESGELTGIISRGDLLRVLQGDLVGEQPGPGGILERKKSGVHKNVKSLMKERLDRDLMALLQSLARIADEAGFTIYVAGGFVRDLLLRIKNLDIDIVVEGEGIEFAKMLGKQLKGRVKSHAKFGTSVIILENGFRIDVATARMEYYTHPAALPTVEKSSIKADLFRRDFTINSMAVKLNGKDAFCLIDFFNGERDLKDRVIRVLHNLSFIEDPCRIFRAIRFEQRFHFVIGKQTEAFMKNAIKKKLIDQLSGSRLLNELILLLKEDDPLKCIRRMKEFSLFPFISPKLLEDSNGLAVLERVPDVISWSKMVPLPREPEIWFIYFQGLFATLDPQAFQYAMNRLRISQRLKNRLEDDRENCKMAIRSLEETDDLAPNQIYEIFNPLSPEAVIYLLAFCDSGRVNKYATLYFTRYHSLAELSLTGDDLIRLGVQPGPIFQNIFKTLREARVNGAIQSRREEMDLVKKQFLKR
ncbi:MAG: CBS domain-containing protein [Nitrospinaceae bacterium]